MKKHVPEYWWDFDLAMRIIVQSWKNPKIAECRTITEAEKMVEDLRAGRLALDSNWELK